MMSVNGKRRNFLLRLLTILSSGFGAFSLAFVALMVFASNTTGAPGSVIIGSGIAALSALAGIGFAFAYFAETPGQTGDEEVSPVVDPITSLLSRCGLENELAHVLDGQDENDTRWMLVSIEIDAFRDINDTHGQETGDRVLRIVANRLKRLVGNLGPVARIAGSEFAFAIAFGNDDREIAAVMSAVINEVGKPIKADRKTITVFCTAGLVELKRDNLSIDKMLRRTNLARATARASGLGNWAIYHPEMTRSASYRKWIEAELVRAVNGDEFDLVYQPQVNSLTGETVGYEALLRWTHPKKGVIPPSEFIPVAEKYGLISQIGSWVMQRACEDARALPPGVTVAINVSPIQLKCDRFVNELAKMFEQTGTRPEQIEIEITENVLIDDHDAVRRQFRSIRSLGCSIAIDDFGTGYSNLGSLADLPFTKLKLDRSLVARLGTRENGGAVVSTIVNLARALDVDILAEGVENEDQVVLLRAAGCRLMQGYYFGKPVAFGKPGDDESRAAPLQKLSA
ncbi:putative bifunctional diguanylate cyclase/phosphodiesterase [Oricola thermophila]|uniref:Bifunctional diguanylate cyclase/phosphodiesterase n=1 Tax=Oricola thermophila TaxID=2742145 RepID=A0A6N1VFH7_9HYPH|nr:bifunctional diguanylate cyclase/phosphodiesterase [Oricola thermophila]QKV19528.1 bifunctional diguanylate cyclase/phosphodiesterase [Oricola thermophila]